MNRIAAAQTNTLAQFWARVSQWFQQLLKSGCNSFICRGREAVAEFNHRLALGKWMAERANRLAEEQKLPAGLRPLAGFLIGLRSPSVLPLWAGTNAFAIDNQRRLTRVNADQANYRLEFVDQRLVFMSADGSDRKIVPSNQPIRLGSEMYCVKLLASDRQMLMPPFEVRL